MYFVNVISTRMYYGLPCIILGTVRQDGGSTLCVSAAQLAAGRWQPGQEETEGRETAAVVPAWQGDAGMDGWLR